MVESLISSICCRQLTFRDIYELHMNDEVPEAEKVGIEMKWWERPVRMMRLDYGPELHRMREADLDILARSKKEEWHVNCEWIIGTPGIAPGLGYQVTFNTPFFEKYPGLEDWDLLRSYLPFARKYGIKVLAYLNMHWYSYDFGTRHPEWQQRMADGKSYGEVVPLYGSGTTFCVNSPWRDWAYLLIREAMKTGIDGVFLDGPVIFPGCCYCDACRARFAERTGKEIPASEDWGSPLWKEFIRFREDSMADFLKGAEKAVREGNPEGVVFLNAGSWHAGSWRVARNIEKVGRYQHFNGAESFFHPGPFDQVLIPWAITAKHLMAGEKPAVVFSHHALGSWHYVPLPDAETRISIAQTVANGANPWFAVFDYALDHSREAALAPIRDLFGFLERNEDYYTATESAAEAAVLFSSQSSAFYLSKEEGLYLEGGSGKEQDLIADVGAGKAIDWKKRKALCDEIQGRSFWGSCYMLTRAHIPYDVILDGQLDDEHLDRYKVLILPNSACLSEEQVSAIRRFVERGGGLVASFETGRYNEDGELEESHSMSEFLGISAIEGAMVPAAFEEYVKVKAHHGAAASFAEGALLPRPLYCLKVRALPDAVDVPCIFMNPTGRLYSALKGESVYPAVVVREIGRGRVVYFPHLLADAYTRYKIREHEQWFVDSVKWAYGSEPPISVLAPPTVEVEVRRQRLDSPHNRGERILIHLVNNTGDMQRPIRDLLPIRGIEIRFSAPFPRAVRALRRNEDLELLKEENKVRVILPELETYEVIVAESQLPSTEVEGMQMPG